MNIYIIIIGWLLTLTCAGLTVLWIAAWLTIRAGKKTASTVEDGLSWQPSDNKGGKNNNENDPTVSIVIPAHNEEAMIAEALESIRRSNYPGRLEIIIVADRCTDTTTTIVREQVAADSRVKLIEVDSCPPDWSGKCHSCWQGYQQTTGEILLFTDADTLFHPDLIRASVGYLKKRNLDFLSLLGRLRCRYNFEKTSQPIAAMALMRMYPIAKANIHKEGRMRRPFANGQFMLFTRSTYENAGTHQRVKNAILEDRRFAGRLSRQGRRMGLTTSGNLFTVRMYETEEQFNRGWKRIFTEGASRNIPRLRASAIRLRLLGLGPILSLMTTIYGGFISKDNPPLGSVTIIAGLVSFILFIFIMRLVYRMQGARTSYLFRFTVGCFRVASIFKEAINDLKQGRGIEWAQLHYHVDAVEEE